MHLTIRASEDQTDFLIRTEDGNIGPFQIETNTLAELLRAVERSTTLSVALIIGEPLQNESLE